MVRNVMMVYFVLLALFSPFVIKILMSIGPRDLPNFSITFLLTALVMMLIPTVAFITGEVEKGLTLALGFGFLHSFVKAFNEEVIFRGVLPRIMGKGIWPDIVSSIIFGIFHLAVTGASILAMLLLMLLGFVWAMVRNRFGLLGAVGSHASYNVAVLGALPMLFGVG